MSYFCSLSTISAHKRRGNGKTTVELSIAQVILGMCLFIIINYDFHLPPLVLAFVCPLLCVFLHSFRNKVYSVFCNMFSYSLVWLNWNWFWVWGNEVIRRNVLKVWIKRIKLNGMMRKYTQFHSRLNWIIEINDSN